MARKNTTEMLTITPGDVAEAAEKNRLILQSALKRASDKNFNDFVMANIRPFGNVIFPESPDSLKH